MGTGTSESILFPSNIVFTLNDTSYLEWLVSSLNPRAVVYGELLETAFSVPFIDIVPNDDNRLAEGLLLRDEYVALTGNQPPDMEHCSLLEMMIALSRRLSDAVYDPDADTRNLWFWRLMRNLDLLMYSDVIMDPVSRENARLALHKVVSREYRRNGSGGLFPLKHPPSDQREVEIWYQMEFWLSENGF